MSKNFYACVYGGASSKLDEKFADDIEKLGKIIVKSGFSLVYGCGASGCMGAAARGVRESGGYIMGVCPAYIGEFEPMFDCDNNMIVETMAERKMIMEKHADIFFIAPGGIGTMDEFFQIITLKYLGRLSAPIVILNLDGYYDSLLVLIDDLVEQGAAAEDIKDSFEVVAEVSEEALCERMARVRQEGRT